MSFEEEVYRDQLYTEQQSKLLTILPRLSAPLSILGSGTILYIVLRDFKRKIRRVYHRLLLAYSSIDVICSFNFALSAAVVPTGTPGVWAAHGTVGTCEASGFVSQFSFALGVYATFICLYYVLVLRYNVRERTLARRAEPFVHAFALVPPLVLGTIMLLQGNYNPTNAIVGWCFINVYPMDCLHRDEIACERGENYHVWLVLHNTPFFFFFAVVSASMILTYTKVRNLEERGAQWSLRRSRQSQHRIRETRTQAFLYISAFFLTYIFLGISTLLGPSPATKEHRNFYLPVVALIKVFLPLQGMWNCIIYIRPRYAAIRLRHPDLPVWGILRMILNSSEEVRVMSHASFDARSSLSGLLTRYWTTPSTGTMARRPRQQSFSGSPSRREETKESISGPSRSSGRFTIEEGQEQNNVDEHDDFMPEFNSEPSSIERPDEIEEEPENQSSLEGTSEIRSAAAPADVEQHSNPSLSTHDTTY